MARLIIVEDNQELANLIASASRSRGHTVVTAHTAGEAIEALNGPRFDAAVVDLLLPDRPGLDVLDALRARKVPAFAVSGVHKGERFAREAIDQHGAAGFFEKPFEMRTVLDAVDRAVGVINAEGLGVEDLNALEELAPIEDDAEEAPPILPGPGKVQATPPTIPLPTRRGAANDHSDAFSDDEPTRPAAPVPELLAKATSGRDDEEPKDSAAPFARRGQVWGEEKAEAPRKVRRPPQPEVSGDIARSPVPRLLTAYFTARHTGELKLKQDTVQKAIEFESGSPVYAASNIATERFGRFCVKKGVVPEKELPVIAAYSRDKQVRTGVAMERLGLITAEQRVKLLEDQVREIIWSTFGWTRGEYQFAPRVQRRTDLVKLVVFPGNLILEGILKTTTLVALRQRLPADRRLFPNADPPYALHEVALTGQQAMLLVHTDGSKTVEDLLSLTDLSERDALATLWAFELMQLVVERVEEPSKPGRRRISFGL